ncbi:MAG: hypothetical protein RLZZ626_697, partial [Actinomycetota bacterium]
PSAPAPIILPPLNSDEPAKPQVPEYAPPTVSTPIIESVQVEDAPVFAPIEAEVAPVIAPVEAEVAPAIDFNNLLREPQTSSIVIDRERFPTGAIDLPPIDAVRPRTGAIPLPSFTVAPTGVDAREAAGTGPIDIVKPVSARVAGAKPKTGVKLRTKRQTTLAFVTAGLMMVVGGLFIAAYLLGYLR